MKLHLVFYLSFLFFITCDNPISTPNELDCIIDYRGFYDDCGVCSGGATNHVANSNKDCSNNCFGSAIIDECGICNGNGSSCNDGDLNYCNFIAGSFYDDCGFCVGGNTGNSENWAVNECGVCDENFGEVDIDLCSVCSGNNTSCNIGLLTLSIFNFDQMHIWNNSDCSGAPYYSFYDEICLNESCNDYSLRFYYDTAAIVGEELKFYQSNNNNDSFYSGEFSLSNELCLDYNFICHQNCIDQHGFPISNNFIQDSSIELDECWESVTFLNTYYDCMNNIDACNNNTLILTQHNEESNSCYQAIYSGENINSVFPTSTSQLNNNFNKINE